jgi:hypothetical protein
LGVGSRHARIAWRIKLMGERGTPVWHYALLHLRKTRPVWLTGCSSLSDMHGMVLNICPTLGDAGVQPRDIPLRGGRTALLFVDAQNFNCHRDGALGSQILVRVQQARRHSMAWSAEPLAMRVLCPDCALLT